MLSKAAPMLVHRKSPFSLLAMRNDDLMSRRNISDKELGRGGLLSWTVYANLLVVRGGVPTRL